MSSTVSQGTATVPVRESEARKRLTERVMGCAIEVHRQLGPSVERFDPMAQVLTYLRVTGKEIGLLMNFNSRLLRDGIKRYVLN